MQTSALLKEENEALKSLVESQAEQLEEKDRQIEELKLMVELCKQQLMLNRKNKYGASSEKCQYDAEQPNFFNEAEETASLCADEPEAETVVRKRSKKRGKAFRELSVVEVEHTLAETEQSCPQCGAQMIEMKRIIRDELKMVPAKVYIERHMQSVYACRECEKNAVTTPIITAPAPKALIPRSMVSPELMAHIMTQKFANHMPLYRQEQDFKRLGVLLSRQNLSNWMLKGAELLRPLTEYLHGEMVKREILHADETTLEVLHEPGREPQIKSHMWVYRTSGDTDKHIVMYDYREGRRGRYAKEYLKDFKGYLHTDGWGGYKQLEPEITLCGCWAHAKRKFFDAHSILANKSPDAPEAVGLSYCQRLFALEKTVRERGMDAAERHKYREEHAKPIIDSFYKWMDELPDSRKLPESLLGKAITYARNQKQYLLAFLKDGRIEISNNRAERSVKPFVMGRKNFLFCNTPRGAHSSAIIYSVVQTAIENGLNPYAYLQYVFEAIRRRGNDDIEPLLPWSDSVPPECRTEKKTESYLEDGEE